jgi:hypothetical protein
LENGISIYPGLDNTLEENLALIETAARHGIKRLFTSLHLPESDVPQLKEELGVILKTAHHHGMEIISDVSPLALKMLGLKEFSPSAFRIRGITTLRLDYGFGTDEIARLSHNSQHIRLQLNASTITGRLLDELLFKRADFSQIDALHNFYPRPHTGLSRETLARKTFMLHKAGIRVGAFVTTQKGKRRGPFGLGLPTLEEHRSCEVSLAARHLIALGIDSIFLADSLPEESEIAALSDLTDRCISLRIQPLTRARATQKLLAHTFQSRIDEARDVIRAEESRQLVKEAKLDIAPSRTQARPRGSITIDNRRGARYMGELEIVKNDLPPDPRVNVVGRILPEEMFLLEYLTPGRKFRFLFSPAT